MSQRRIKTKHRHGQDGTKRTPPDEIPKGIGRVVAEWGAGATFCAACIGQMVNASYDAGLDCGFADELRRNPGYAGNVGRKAPETFKKTSHDFNVIMGLFTDMSNLYREMERLHRSGEGVPDHLFERIKHLTSGVQEAGRRLSPLESRICQFAFDDARRIVAAHSPKGPEATA